MSNHFPKIALALAVVLALFAWPIARTHAQAPVQVQQINSHLDAATLVLSTATSNQTNTITPPAGQYVYVTGLDIENCASGTNVTAAATSSLTTTNLGGIAWLIGVGPLAGACTYPIPFVGPTVLKSVAPGTAVTFVVPTFGTNQTIRLNVYYYFGY